MGGNKENIQKVASVFGRVNEVVSPYMKAKNALPNLLPKGPAMMDAATKTLVDQHKFVMSYFENSDRIRVACGLLDDLHEEQLQIDKTLKPRDQLAHEVILHKAEMLYEAGAVEAAEDTLGAEMDRAQIETGKIAHPSVYLMLASIHAQDPKGPQDAIKLLENMLNPEEDPRLKNFVAPNKMSASKMLSILTAQQKKSLKVPEPAKV
jgi:hypothetical protein